MRCAINKTHITYTYTFHIIIIIIIKTWEVKFLHRIKCFTVSSSCRNFIKHERYYRGSGGFTSYWYSQCLLIKICLVQWTERPTPTHYLTRLSLSPTYTLFSSPFRSAAALFRQILSRITYTNQGKTFEVCLFVAGAGECCNKTISEEVVVGTGMVV